MGPPEVILRRRSPGLAAGRLVFRCFGRPDTIPLDFNLAGRPKPADGMDARTPLDQLNPGRICLIKPSALGDVVQSLPVLAGLRRRWPNAHISWVIHRGLAGILAGHPQIDELIPFDRAARGWQRIGSSWELARRLWQSKFDLTIDLQGLMRTGLMTLATGAARRVGFASAREGAPWAYTDRVEVENRLQSAVTRYWLVARALGCAEPMPPAARFGLTPAHEAWGAEQLAALPRPRLAIHPGAQWATKRWPPEHFAALAERAQREFGAGVLLVGGPGERALADRIAARLRGPLVNLAERTNLLELAAVLASADVACSGDTGPMHLAAALGTRVVAVFTCTNPVLAGPYGSGHRVVATHVHCAASYRKTCPTMICMEELTPERVWPALAAALGEIAARPSVQAG